MTEPQVWQYLSSARQQSGGDQNAFCEALRQQLLALPHPEIEAFDDLMHELAGRIPFSARRWMVRHDYLYIGSDDGWSDFVYWLIAQGEETYRKVQRRATALAEVLAGIERVPQFEALTYVAMKAFEEKTGLDIYTKEPPKEVPVIWLCPKPSEQP